MPIAHVQTVQAGVAAGTSTSIAVTANVTAGNGIIINLLFDSDKATAGTIVQTSPGTSTNNASLAFERNNTGLYAQQLVIPGISSGGNISFAWSHTGSVNSRIYVTEVSSQTTSTDIFDVFNASTFGGLSTTPTATSTGYVTATLAQADEIGIALMHGDASGPTTMSTTPVTNGWTVPTNGDQVGALFMPACLAFKVNNTTTGMGTSFVTIDPESAWTIVGTYKGAVSVVPDWVDNTIFRPRLRVY